LKSTETVYRKYALGSRIVDTSNGRVYMTKPDQKTWVSVPSRPSYDINVWDYGAKGDGSTDDVIALQAAIDAAELVNGTVYLPPGTYMISDTLVISSHITFRGAGHGYNTPAAAKATTIIQKSVDNLGILVSDGADYTVLENFMLYSALGSATTNGIEIGQASNATNGVSYAVLRNILVRGCYDGVDVRQGNVGLMDNVIAIGNYRHGIAIDSDRPDTVINTNAWTLLHCIGGSNAGDGLSIVDGKDITVLGGDFESNGARGIYTNGSRGYIRSYAESNIGNDFECGSLAQASWFMVQATTVSLGTNKVMYIDQTPSPKSLYNDASNNWTIQEGTLTLAGPNSDYDYVKWGMTQEDVTLSTGGVTTDTAATFLPANAIIESVIAFVVTTISGGGVANFSVGDAAQSARFISAYSTLTSGGKKVGLLHMDPTVASANLGPVQGSAASARITCDATPTAGVVRLTVFYRQYVAEV